MPVNTTLSNVIWHRYQFLRDNGHAQYVAKADMCNKYFMGDQWTDTDRQTLRQQRRPALTINKIISTIGNVMGEQIYSRSEIGFRPKSGASDETAETLVKVFKSISDNNMLDWKRSDMFADGIITSRGFMDIRLDFTDEMQGEVRYETLNPKNVLIDNDAHESDPDSWNEVLTTKWLTADDIAIMYSKEDAELLRNREQSYYPYGYDSIDINRDRFGTAYNPVHGGANNLDFSSVTRNLRVIERQHRVMDRQDHFINPQTGDMRPVPDGWDTNRIAAVRQQFGLEVIPKLVKRIRWGVICDNVQLHDDWSPYKHFTVVPYFPYLRYGQTVGLVENLIGPQELLNKVSSQELHVVNTTANSGWKVKTGAMTNMSVEELEQKGAQTGLVIEYNNTPEEIEKITPNGTPQGLDRISYKAEEHIKTISGVSDSQQGMDREDVSGKAIQAKRQASSTNMVKPLDSLVRTDYYIARNTLDLIQTFYTEPRLISITHNQNGGGTEQVNVNQQTPEGEILNDLTLGEYDVTISSVPQRETLEDSQFEQAKALKELGIAIPDSVLINASRLMNKNDIIKQMSAGQDSPEAKAAAELQKRGQTAEVAKTEAEVAQKQADAGLKQAKTQKEGVTTQKEAATPIDTGDGANAADMQKVEFEMDLENRKFEHEKELDAQKMALEREKMMNDQKLAAQAQAQKAVTDRIAAAKPASAAGARA